MNTLEKVKKVNNLKLFLKIIGFEENTNSSFYESKFVCKKNCITYDILISYNNDISLSERHDFIRPHNDKLIAKSIEEIDNLIDFLKIIFKKELRINRINKLLNVQ